MDDYSTLTMTEKVTILKIKQLGTGILTMNLQQIADHCSVSTATIKRTLNKLEYNSLKEYKLSINVPLELNTNNLSAFENHICQITSEYDPKLLHNVSLMINESQFIYVVAFGLSTSIAMEMSIHLRKTGKKIVYINDSDALNQISENSIKNSDLIIYISYSGEDTDMVNFATLLRSKATQILITTSVDCPLASLCNHTLYSNDRSVPNPFKSRIPMNIISYKLIATYYGLFPN